MTIKQIIAEIELQAWAKRHLQDVLRKHSELAPFFG
jgi:hypothetical protein